MDTKDIFASVDRVFVFISPSEETPRIKTEADSCWISVKVIGFRKVSFGIREFRTTERSSRGADVSVFDIVLVNPRSFFIFEGEDHVDWISSNLQSSLGVVEVRKEHGSKARYRKLKDLSMVSLTFEYLYLFG